MGVKGTTLRGLILPEASPAGKVWFWALRELPCRDYTSVTMVLWVETLFLTLVYNSRNHSDFIHLILMRDSILLVIEGKHADHPAFVPALRKKGFVVELVSNGSEALARLAGGFSPDVVVVNAASLRTSGKRICQSLRDKAPKLPILLILDPDREIEKVEADIILSLPFTAQKLVNRIRHLLPGDGSDDIHAGPVCLDVEKRVVHCLEKQTRLTPRLMRLLKTLIDHQGEVIERKVLFSQVWETDYTDDTRTLDVHISWLRRAIEVTPEDPKFLKTIRGVGYRLDV
jgi:DNA-binding response OmpR family regulator